MWWLKAIIIQKQPPEVFHRNGYFIVTFPFLFSYSDLNSFSFFPVFDFYFLLVFYWILTFCSRSVSFFAISFFSFICIFFILNNKSTKQSKTKQIKSQRQSKSLRLCGRNILNLVLNLWRVIFKQKAQIALKKILVIFGEHWLSYYIIFCD